MVVESVIKGREQMHLIAIGGVPGNLFLVICTFIVLASGYGVPAVACVIVASRVVTLISMLLLFHFSSADCRWGRLRPRLAGLLLRRSLVFLGTDSILAVHASLLGVLLSKFASEREVGLLGASFQLLQPFLMFYRSAAHGSFPSLVSAAQFSGAAVGALARSILGLMIRLAFPATLIVFCLAGDLLVTVYGNSDFREASLVVKILAFTLLLDPLAPILGHGMWAMNRDRTVFRIVIANLIAGAAIGLILIGQFGLIGAACAALISSIVNTIQHYYFFNRLVDRLHLGHQIVKIAPAAVAAIACIVLLPISRYVSVSVAVLTYMGLAFLPGDKVSLRGHVTPDSGD
jgi:O-antigen/teichoic acid export membrane protein